jgi:ribosome-binding factor A
MNSSSGHVRRAQKESLLFREISQLFLEASLDDPKLHTITINRVGLSPDKSICTIYFYTPDGQSYFEKELLPILVQYKSSLRRALAARVPARYTPELLFAYDKQFEKQLRIEQLLEEVKEDTE